MLRLRETRPPYTRKGTRGTGEGIAAQKKLDMYGLKSRPLMTVDEMQKASKTHDCPSEALHEVDCTGMVAVDDVSGQTLVPALMVKARRDEISYFR